MTAFEGLQTLATTIPSRPKVKFLGIKVRDAREGWAETAFWAASATASRIISVKTPLITMPEARQGRGIRTFSGVVGHA